MKAALVGVGQAGGKLTEALVRNDRENGYGAVQGALAVNTARQDLTPLDIPTLLIGQSVVSGDGVGGENELGAELMEEDTREVVNALDGTITSRTEAVFVVAGLGGGTGSGGAPVLVRELKRVYDIPVYCLGVLPGRNEGALYQANAGRSLKTVVREADNTLLVDNDAWHASGESVTDAYAAINDTVAHRIGLLLAAGEVTDGVAESVVDSSEIINTLRNGSMAAIGYANADASPDPEENINVVTSTARKSLLTGMSVPETTDADAALVIVAGHPDRIPRKGVERARRWIEDETGSTQVRGGDYPLESDQIAVLVLLSGITRSPRIESFLDRAREAANTDPDPEPDPAEAFQNDDLDGLF